MPGTNHHAPDGRRHRYQRQTLQIDRLKHACMHACIHTYTCGRHHRYQRQTLQTDRLMEQKRVSSTNNHAPNRRRHDNCHKLSRPRPCAPPRPPLCRPPPTRTNSVGSPAVNLHIHPRAGRTATVLTPRCKTATVLRCGRKNWKVE